MDYDWKALAPTRPLAIADVGADGLYVPRAHDGALEIDALLNAGLEQPIAIFGPAGAGKSTELAALAKRRASTWVGPLIRLDKVLAYSDATSVDDVLEAIAKFAIGWAIEKLGMSLSAELAGFAAPPAVQARPLLGPAGFDLLLATVREIRNASAQGVVGLLVDGLEKASSGLARRTLGQLERLRGEARIVVVVPTAIATGPSASALHDYHVMSIGPVVVSQDVCPSWPDGFRFLFEIAARRLGKPAEDIGKEQPWDTTAVAMRRCIDASGGLIRTYLQLLQKAALYAAVRGRRVPDEADVARAAQEQTSFLLRLLKEGDVEALRAAHGTTGREIDIDRRVRFLANGILLEYSTSAGSVVRIAPLLANTILGADTRG